MWHRATIQSRKQLSPSVTGLTLKIQASNPTTNSFTFVPGQWVDFQPLPNSTSWKPKDYRKTVGGYSITSIPKSLPYIELAIQSSRHPVAEWVTCHAQVNDEVNVRVGGSFTCASDERSTDVTSQSANDKDAATNNITSPQRLLFVAGGIGITPLISIIQQWHEDQKQNDKSEHDSMAVLLYSAKFKGDMLFVRELNEMVGQSREKLRVVLTTTAPCTDIEYPEEIIAVQKDNSMSNVLYNRGRINREMIKDAICWMNMRDNVVDDERRQVGEGEDGMIADLVYICGPPGLPEDIQPLLYPLDNDNGQQFVRCEKDIRFEKWW